MRGGNHFENDARFLFGLQLAYGNGSRNLGARPQAVEYINLLLPLL